MTMWVFISKSYLLLIQPRTLSPTIQYQYSRFSYNFLKRQKEKYLNSLILWGRINLSDFNNSVIFFICKLKWNIGCRSVGNSINECGGDYIEYMYWYTLYWSSVLTITEELSRLPGAQSLNSALALCSPQRWREGEQQIFFFNANFQVNTYEEAP